MATTLICPIQSGMEALFKTAMAVHTIQKMSDGRGLEGRGTKLRTSSQ